MTRAPGRGPLETDRPADAPAGIGADSTTLRGVRLVGDGDDADGPDVDLALAVVSAVERASEDPRRSTRERVRWLLAGPYADRAGHLLALDLTGPIGLLVVVAVPTGTVFLETYVRPGAPSTLRPALLADGLATARRIAAGSAIPWQAGASTTTRDPGGREMLAAAGFRPYRRYERRRIGLTQAAAEPPPPAGVARHLARSADDLRRVHAVLAESFAYDDAAAPPPYDDWLASVLARPDHDPDGVWLAVLDGRAVAVCMVDDEWAHLGDAYVRALGVVPVARGRGIGGWLMRCAVGDAVRRGRHGLRLTVSTTAPAAARALYDSLGLQVVDVLDEWRLPLTR